MSVAARVEFTWRGLGKCGGADRYKRDFESREDAQDFMTDVLELRKAPPGQPKAPAEWTVICESGERRLLGSADSGFLVSLVERKAVAA